MTPHEGLPESLPGRTEPRADPLPAGEPTERVCILAHGGFA